MPERNTPASHMAVATYSNTVGFIFIFNLIVGTGALTLPGVFARAGWLLSLFVIILLAFISYMAVTFIIEAMACSNAIRNWQNMQFIRHRRISQEEEVDSEEENIESSNELETIPLNIESMEFHYYQLTHKFELGEMATLFFNDVGRYMFYLCFIIYLYGDLSIYSAAVARSIRDVVCAHLNHTDNSIKGTHFPYWPGDFQGNDNFACWKKHTLTRLSMYRVILIVFTVIFGPLVLFSIQKTKYLQILTTIFRWLAFTLMISIALKLLITNGPKGHPVSMNLYGIPSLFGACVYSFMCHHSLPNLLAPLRDKINAIKILSYNYIVICTFYIALAMTGIFAFEHVADLYTLNFLPDQDKPTDFSSVLLTIANYFLSLFPVFTLCASYPLIAVTLKNNLQILFFDMSRFDSYNLCLRLICPFFAVIPPFCVTYFTESLSTLVAFTGSYAGAGIQYVIPVCLVYFSRRTCSELLGSGIINHFQSPFKSNIWLVLILIWSAQCVTLVTLNLIR